MTPLLLILPSLCSSWRVVRCGVLAKGLLKDPGSWGWAGPGAPWRGRGPELPPFMLCAVRGSRFHFYRKGFSAAFHKTWIFMLNQGVSAAQNELEEWDVEAGLVGDGAHVCLHVLQAAIHFLEPSPSGGRAQSPRPCCLELSRVQPQRPLWLVPQDSGLCFLPATRLSPTSLTF